MTTAGLELRARTPPPPLRIGLRGRVRAWLWVNRLSLVAGGCGVTLVGAVHAIGMAGYPAIVDDEGTYVAQAFAVNRWHELAHYTYWYDHPPLGWLQIAGWFRLTGAMGRAPFAVAGGREAMVAALVVASGMLFLLARRLGVRRPFAVLAVLLFGLSPLAIAFQRSVYLDNVAAPWLLGAFVLAASRRKHLGAAAGAAVCFAVAVLSKETTLVLLPALLWQLWASADTRTRRFVMAVFGGLFASLILLYPLFALLRNELLPGPGHVSLVWSAAWQLFSRPSSGSLLDPASGARGVLSSWTGIDPWILVLGVVALPFGFVVKRMRPVAAALAIQLVMMLRGGYLPFPYIVVLLPFCALVAAGVLDAALRPHDVTTRPPLVRSLAVFGRWLVVGGALLVGALLVPAWTRGDISAMSSRQTGAMVDAAKWVDQNVSRQAVIAVDDSIWVDLVRNGFARDRVLWFYKVDLDPAVTPAGGWRALDYVVLGELPAGTAGSSLPVISAAIQHSTIVAEFGQGPSRVSVRKVNR